MPSVDEVVARIVGADVPVLFGDTCILLDIIRSTKRRLRDYAERASELLGLVTVTPPRCLLVISSIIPREWETHAQEVTDEVARHLVEMQEQSSHFHDACGILGIPAGFERANYAGPGLPDRLRDLSRQLLESALCLDADDQSRARAVGRVVTNTPPSRKGGEVKDCTILEEYLAVCRGLQAAGFMRKRVLCTSNTDDFCEVGKKLHPTLAMEFQALDLAFTSNLNWALHEIIH
jgi:hypothetical protein